ncbi:winged helix-turn-helix domain-containing protein [Streptomyces sp. NPDC088788]|uniref:helix-turn-helix domain-containing protein n=1 Tax=Streptomyces sp. NPDC088788 TaxID=3365898 RepID=UPI00380972F2
MDCSSAAAWALLHRRGWSWQSPALRALERDEDALGLWQREVWPHLLIVSEWSSPLGLAVGCCDGRIC